MIPPPPVLLRRIRHGEMLLLSSGFSFRSIPPKTLTGYPVAEWPSRWEAVYHPPREAFDWGNLIGAVIVIGVPVYVLFLILRALGWV